MNLECNILRIVVGTCHTGLGAPHSHVACVPVIHHGRGHRPTLIGGAAITWYGNWSPVGGNIQAFCSCGYRTYRKVGGSSADERTIETRNSDRFDIGDSSEILNPLYLLLFRYSVGNSDIVHNNSY